MRDKFIGFFRLIEACERPGCPVCACMIADTRHYLDSVLYEQVTDPATRGRLRESWGFCNWHSSLLREIPNSAFGSAIVSEDLLGAVIRRFERLRAGGPVGLWRRLWGRVTRDSAASPLPGSQDRPPCPACVHLASAEDRYVESMLRFSLDPQFERAYEHSQGLCVPHALLAVERATAARPAQPLLARTIPKWAELRRDLEGFVSTHDHRNRRPCTEAEANAPVRAFEVLTGAQGLVPRNLRDGRRSSREQLLPGTSPSPALESQRAGVEFERADQDPTERGLLGSPEQLARDALKRSGQVERVARDRKEQVIEDLRREVERLQAELAAARTSALGRPGKGGEPESSTGGRT